MVAIAVDQNQLKNLNRLRYPHLLPSDWSKW